MVFGTWLEDTLKKRWQRQISTAADNARSEERRRWLKWNQRREAAGEDFNEPPPGIDDIDIENSQRDE